MYRLDGYELDGRRLAVVEAKDRRKSPDELRARDMDRRRDDRPERPERHDRPDRRRSRSRDRDFRGEPRGMRGGSRDRFVS